MIHITPEAAKQVCDLVADKKKGIFPKLASADEVLGADGAEQRNVDEVLGGVSTGTTPQFAAQVEFRKNSDPNELGLRLCIEKGGCAGQQYSMALGPEQAGDTVIHQDGASIFIDSNSLSLLQECTLDYEDGLTGAGFRILNPNAVRSCGCGTSFEPAKPVKSEG